MRKTKTIFLFGILICILGMMTACGGNGGKVAREIGKNVTKNAGKAGKQAHKLQYNKKIRPQKRETKENDLKEVGIEIGKEGLKKAVECTSAWECPNCGLRFEIKTSIPRLYKRCDKCGREMRKLK